MRMLFLFDVDNTLISQDSLGDNVRPLFFPATTKEVIDSLVKRDDLVVLFSDQTEEAAIRASLEAIEIKIDKIKIIGRSESKTIQTTYPDKQHKVRWALSEMESKKLEYVIIVEDAYRINSENPKLVHVLVPLQNEQPLSDAYLRVTLLPKETLFAIKPTVNSELSKAREKASESRRAMVINAASLNEYYNSALEVSSPYQYGKLSEPKPPAFKAVNPAELAKFLNYTQATPQELRRIFNISKISPDQFPKIEQNSPLLNLPSGVLRIIANLLLVNKNFKDLSALSQTCQQWRDLSKAARNQAILISNKFRLIGVRILGDNQNEISQFAKDLVLIDSLNPEKPIEDGRYMEQCARIFCYEGTHFRLKLRWVEFPKHIWDFARPGYVGAVFMLDLTDKVSLQNLKLWIKDHERTCPKESQMLVLGHGSNLSNRVISKEEAEEFCKGIMPHYLETPDIRTALAKIEELAAGEFLSRQHIPSKNNAPLAAPTGNHDNPILSKNLGELIDAADPIRSQYLLNLIKSHQDQDPKFKIKILVLFKLHSMSLAFKGPSHDWIKRQLEKYSKEDLKTSDEFIFTNLAQIQCISTILSHLLEFQKSWNSYLTFFEKSKKEREQNTWFMLNFSERMLDFIFMKNSSDQKPESIVNNNNEISRSDLSSFLLKLLEIPGSGLTGATLHEMVQQMLTAFCNPEVPLINQSEEVDAINPSPTL